MMKRSRLRARQEKMFAKHHSVRAWHHVKRRETKRGRQYILSLYESGMSDEQIAAETNLSVAGAKLFRLAVYMPYLERLAKSRDRSLENQRIARILGK